MPNEILGPILRPLIGAIIVLLIPKRMEKLRNAVALFFTFFTLAAVISIFNKDINYSLPLVGHGMDATFRNYNFSSFITAAATLFTLLVTIYSTVFFKGKDNAKAFTFFMLVTLSFVNGAVLSNDLVLLLFFWEGLLIALFGMIYIGGKDSFKTAIKAFTINGITDVIMMVGIALTVYLAKSSTMSQIHLPLNALGAAAFTMLMIGAISKAGSMPFHSWIPDAATDAPLPFMALLPAALEKLLGIYFLARISMDLFALTSGSWVSIMMMTIGAITILAAVMMALIQKDYKKLLSYHAISQVGYMVLGIGTALPVGIVGGLFHMINHATYKACLFLSAGSVEKQIGTTNLSKLGGLGKAMPITFACFFIAACSISGVPPFNGFFSKELVYDAAMERGLIFYFAAVIGSFLTAASFLKLGHAAYFGNSSSNVNAKEAPASILVPMIVLASVCVFFGIYNSVPINGLIVPLLNKVPVGHHFAGWPSNALLVVISLLVSTFAIVVHLYNVKVKGSALKSADYLHYAPGLHQVYDAAEQKLTDPYNIFMRFIGLFSGLSMQIDRAIDWIYQVFAVRIASSVSKMIKAMHDGNYSLYLGWSIVGAFAVMYIMLFTR